MGRLIATHRGIFSDPPVRPAPELERFRFYDSVVKEFPCDSRHLQRVNGASLRLTAVSAATFKAAHLVQPRGCKARADRERTLSFTKHSSKVKENPRD